MASSVAAQATAEIAAHRSAVAHADEQVAQMTERLSECVKQAAAAREQCSSEVTAAKAQIAAAAATDLDDL